MVPTLAMHDVPSDGDCFYTCLSRCLLCHDALCSQLSLATRHDVPRFWRKLLARILQRREEFHVWLHATIKLIEDDPTLSSDYPFIERAAHIEGDDPVASCAAAIRERGVWASEFEISMTQAILSAKGLALLVVEDKDLFEEDLQHMLSHVDGEEACVVMVRVGDSHYTYLTLNYQPIVSPVDLKDYLHWIL